MTETRVFQAVRHALTIISNRGEWKQTPEPFSLMVATIDTFILGYRAPSQTLPIPECHLQNALEPASDALPYGLDLWFEGRKRMFVTWNETGDFITHSFKSDDWEDILSLKAGANEGGI